ncbi:MAG: translocation/assembly module TamB domain-containing protein [Pseudomonadota bacterium]
MASDSRPDAVTGRRSRLRFAIIVVAVLLTMVFASGAWLLGSERGTRVVFSIVQNLTSGSLQVSGVHGSLSGPLQLDQISVDGKDQRLTFRNVQLDWQPSALFSRRLHVRLLRIGHLGINSKMQERTAPLTLPDSLTLPVALQIDRVQVDAGSLGWGPLNMVDLGALVFNLDFDGKRYRLGLDRMALQSAQANSQLSAHFSGDTTLSATRPYALQSRLRSGGATSFQERAIDASGQVNIDGTLAELAATIDLAVGQAQAKGSVLLRPFSAQPLGNANLVVQALDLSALAPALPRTALELRLLSRADGSGELTAGNAAAGLYNQARLPLADLRLAFKQSGGGFFFEPIAATLGTAAHPAGKVSGDARFVNGALTLKLTTRALNLQRLDNRLRATRLAGSADITHAAGQQQLTLALTEPWNKNTLALSAQAVLADAGLTVKSAELRAGEARVSASGHVDLSGRQSFTAEGRISRLRLQELGDFANLPRLDLNGSFSLRGTRSPKLEADLSFQITDSRVAGYPLHGDGRAQLRADRITIPKLLLVGGDNRLSMEGELAQRDSRLTFALSAPRLDQLGPLFGGALQANGTARGSLTAPQVSATWRADRVRLPGAVQIDAMQGTAAFGIDPAQPFFISGASIDASAGRLKSGTLDLAALSTKIRYAPQPNAPLALELHARNVSSGELRANSIDISASGTTARHTLDAALTDARQNWRMRASGGLRDLASTAQWQGNIDRLDASGAFTAQLAAPAPFSVSQRTVQLERFRIDSGNGSMVIDHFLRDQRGIVTRGQVDRLLLAPLLKFASSSPVLTTDLQLAGEWNLNIASTVSGSIKVRRQQGDIVMRGSAPVALGLRALEASVTASDGRLNVQLAADGQQLGRIDARVSTSMAGGSSRFSIAPDAPLSGTARLDIPNIGWAAPLISASLIAEGRLRSDLSIAGSFADPRLAGQINGSGLRLFFADLGVDLRQGMLESEFSGAALVIKTLRFQNEGGHLQAAGAIRLTAGKPAAQLALTAERFSVMNRSDRKLTVSGASQLVLADGRAKVTGGVKVDSGFFDIGREDMPQLSSDVVIVGRSKKPAGQIAAAIDVSIDLGNDVVLRGRGLDAVLAGQFRLLSTAGEPLQAQGTVRAAKGTYKAYGRALAIEQGLLRFTGPLNNPALDIVAMRRGQSVEAGVSVRGTVLAPRVTLVSEPVVADAEKLSWLVLGRGLGTTGDADLGALQSAAAALLSEGAASGVQSQIATAFGLDTFSVSTSQDNLQQRIITLGKQISSRLHVSYQQGLATATSALLIRYTLTPRLTLEAEAGTRSVLSLFYNISFD